MLMLCAVVCKYINTRTTNLGFNFNLYQAFKHQGYRDTDTDTGIQIQIQIQGCRYRYRDTDTDTGIQHGYT